MQGIPTVAEVRDWCGVTTSTITDEALSMIREAELAVQARLLDVPHDPEESGVSAVITLTGYELVVNVAGAPPNTAYRLSAGNGQNGDAVTDVNGEATIDYTYPQPGTFTITVTNAQTGAMVATGDLTVPGNHTWTQGPVEATYPPPLVTALLRRCQRSVAAKQVPLGMVGDSAGEYGATYLRSWDPEIERLENPYRIPVIA